MRQDRCHAPDAPCESATPPGRQLPMTHCFVPRTAIVAKMPVGRLKTDEKALDKPFYPLFNPHHHRLGQGIVPAELPSTVSIPSTEIEKKG
ncbi:hypothetical protein F3Y22_tig00000340pilonHSYRG01187 [Hibiscus syriacus]|uniref:Uncharacterized protein n=1 Tax=Hibiscus syriacus TaxID=106335 RepID=A0A6A3D2G3_HIBSY|nr:hypothetical protein F3Y22_tig00000340pilonHSYRG01187 [Hibiscus syriacus]